MYTNKSHFYKIILNVYINKIMNKLIEIPVNFIFGEW